MHSCQVCGRSFETKQALGGHRSMAHGIEKASEPIKQAMGNALAVGRGKATTHYPLPTTHYPLPAKIDTISTTHNPLPTTHYPLPTTRLAAPVELDDEDLSVYERRVKRQELRDKLRAREQEVSGREGRFAGLVLVGLGLLIFLKSGGKLKLPFFGSPAV